MVISFKIDRQCREYCWLIADFLEEIDHSREADTIIESMVNLEREEHAILS